MARKKKNPANSALLQQQGQASNSGKTENDNNCVAKKKRRRRNKRKPRYPQKRSRGSRRAVHAHPIEMVVVHKNYPGEMLTDMEANIVLADILRQVILCPEGRGPQFINSCVIKGIVYLSCDNAWTQRWLEATAKNLRPWNEACLRAHPSHRILPALRVSVWVPTEFIPNSGDTQYLLRLFENQNHGLSTVGWSLYSMERDPRGVTLKLDIDADSVNWLTRHYFHAYFGFQKVTFTWEEDPKPEPGNSSFTV